MFQITGCVLILTIFTIFNIRVVGNTSIKISHKRCDILCGSQPRMNIVAGIQKAPSCDRDVPDWMPVERKIEWQFYCHGSSMRLRE